MRQQDKASSSSDVRPDEELPYAVELWNESRTGVEKILARAFRLSLARAIFLAALQESPGRRVVVRHGERIIEDNGK